MRTRFLLAGLATALAALFLALPSWAATTPCGAPVVTGGTATVTCAYTGDAQTWTVPAGVNSASFDVQGAQGGNSTGGNGGRAVATLDVTPGAVVNVFVGGAGSGGFNGGGFNGGGSGGASGGGGASDIRLGGTDLTERVLIAGGGGGGGLGSGAGGGGGGLTGGDGTLGCCATGGAGGNQNGTTGSGILGIGGSGGNGGGGGGGYYGGASGTMGNAGGGGGSGFGPTGVAFTTGYRAGNGQVVITYTVSAVNDPTSTSVSCSPGSAVVGQPTTCTATVNDTATSGQTTPTGTVSFSSDTSGGSFSSSGSCDLTATGTGQASCSVDYTPGQVGSGTHTIHANYGADSTHLASSGTTTITVTGRTTSTSVICTTANSTPQQCTATVTDTGSGTASTPTGTVAFSSSSRGSFSPTTCTLVSASGASASCSVSFMSHPPRKAAGQTITATYSGDSTHSGSFGTTVLSP